MSSLKKNFIYNFAYQILILILPLVTTPYVSRVLGVNNVGIYSYTYSIVYYFMMISMLGVNNYGNRTIAKSRNNKKELSKNFWNIYYLQIIMSILMIIIYLIYCLFIVKNNKLIAYIQIIYIFSAMFDINWFFFGIDKFKNTVIRSTILILLSFILIFILVKSKNDLWLYTLILSVSTFFSQFLMHFFLKKEVEKYRFNFQEVKEHFKPCVILFVPVIAISLYKIMDKIMLGSMISTIEVGLYEQAEKIINVPTSIITALGTVMLPRISNLVSKGDNQKISVYIEKSIKFMMFLAYPMCLGLIAISSKFIPLYLGNGFEKSSIILNLLSITLVFVSFANVIRKQYLVPKEKDKIFINSVFLGALINFVANLILIKKYASYGAAIGTVLAEFVVMFYQAYKVRKELPIKKYITETTTFLLKAIVMFIIVYLFNYFNINDILRLLIQIFIGGLMYSVLNTKYILSIINIDKIIKKITKQTNFKSS